MTLRRPSLIRSPRRSRAVALGLGAAGLAAVAVAAARRTRPRSGYRQTPLWLAYGRLAELTDRAIGWDRLPRPIGLAVLLGLRNQLRQQNLYDTHRVPAPPPDPADPSARTRRTEDGDYNDLDAPRMGAAGRRFGRNVPLEHTRPDPPDRILEPSPRVVSRELMTRHRFTPATSVNLMAASWIQFMVRDWFSHGYGDPNHAWELPLSADDPWPSRPMRILKTPVAPPEPGDAQAPPAYRNVESHWWDASQVYGTSSRPGIGPRTGSGGKIGIGAGGRLLFPEDPAADPTRVPGWWLGTEMMGSIFVLEHNAICDALVAAYPHWSDEELYQRARLITAALTARIHTVEWTPAIIAHPTAATSLRVNWWGLTGERIRQTFGRLTSSEAISGIPGSPTAHCGVPYSLTEEFAIVYRMHPLIPDDFEFRSAADDALLGQYALPDLSGPNAKRVSAEHAHQDLFYSFGTSHPGAISLHNFPRHLQEFQRPDNGELMDLAATDIMRTREFGVPRYNAFRRLLRLAPARSFADLTDNREWAEELHRVYHGDIEAVDLIVGMFAERKPDGFAFSDTAFRVFILMASRRLNSDRFYTEDFDPDVYTQVGIEWIQHTTMKDVLLRHYPGLRPALREVDNAFQPWAPVAARPAPARATAAAGQARTRQAPPKVTVGRG